MAMLTIEAEVSRLRRELNKDLKKMTFKEVGKKVGVSYTAIYNIHRGGLGNLRTWLKVEKYQRKKEV